MNKKNLQEEKSTNISLPLSGVAPNVLRELSGIYPTFSSAFKELISNAYDADASLVQIQVSSDFKSITIEDDGVGMTPLELQNEYIRIGGTAQHKRHNMTTNGRRPIGRKGIGFLAIGRYCDKVEIHSYNGKKIVFNKDIFVKQESNNKRIDFSDGPISTALGQFTTIQSMVLGKTKIKPAQFKQEDSQIILSDKAYSQLEGHTIAIQYLIDFSQIDVFATIDYNYLLGLNDNFNLDNLDNFCHVKLIDHTPSKLSHFTRITLYLRDFVQQELKTAKKRGRVRNIVSESGIDNFLWNLSRSTPISYNLNQHELRKYGLESLSTPLSSTPFEVKVTDPNNKTYELRRPIMDVADDVSPKSVIARQDINIDSEDFHVHGSILGFSQPIFPAELRGVALRVRGVEIGQPGFLGVETELPVRYRSLLSQVMGEIIITEGLDAINSITPGRRGFYNENSNFNTLRTLLVGDGISNFGAIGQILHEIWELNSVKSSTMRILQEAKQRRDALLCVSHALTGLSISPRYGHSLRRLFSQSEIKAQSLGKVPEFRDELPNSIGKFTIYFSEIIEQDYELDTDNKIVHINSKSDYWAKSLYLLNRDFQISLRDDGSNGTLCEIDFSNSTIYINWMHPTRSKMGSAMFIKSALFWRIAYLATENNADAMIEMAHLLLTFTP